MVAAISAWGATVQGHGKKTLFWITTALSALCLVLVGVDIILLLVNQRAQAEVNERQRTIAESIQLKQLQDGIVRALANAANANKDDQIRDLLVQLGFATITPAPAAAPGAAAPPAPATGVKN
jgi:hypothetical protein